MMKTTKSILYCAGHMDRLFIFGDLVLSCQVPVFSRSVLDSFLSIIPSQRYFHAAIVDAFGKDDII